MRERVLVREEVGGRILASSVDEGENQRWGLVDLLSKISKSEPLSSLSLTVLGYAGPLWCVFVSVRCHFSHTIFGPTRLP